VKLDELAETVDGYRLKNKQMVKLEGMFDLIKFHKQLEKEKEARTRRKTVKQVSFDVQQHS